MSARSTPCAASRTSPRLATGLVLEAVTVQAAGRRRVVRVVVDLPAQATGGVPHDAVAERLAAAVPAARRQRRDGRRRLRARGDLARGSTGR